MAGIDEFLKAFELGYKLFKSPQEKRDEAEDKAWVRESRQMKRDENKYAIEDRAFNRETALFNRGIAAEERKYAIEDRGIAKEERAFKREGDIQNREQDINTTALTDANLTLELKNKAAAAAGADSLAVGAGAVMSNVGDTVGGIYGNTAIPPPDTPPAPGLTRGIAIPPPNGAPAANAPNVETMPDAPLTRELVLDTPEQYKTAATDVVRQTATDRAKGMGGEEAIPTSETQKRTKELLLGAGAAPVGQVKKLLDHIHAQAPDATDEEAGMIAFASIHKYWIGEGKPDKAKEAAGQLLQYYQLAANRYGAIAAAAAEKGDVKEALDAAVKQEQNIPDGASLKYKINKDKSIDITYFDSNTKKELSRHVISPDQIGTIGLGLASPLHFQDQIIRMAGLKEQGGSAAFKEAMRIQQEGIQTPDRLTVSNIGETQTIPGERITPDKPDYILLGQMETDAERNDYLKLFPDAKPRTPSEIDTLTQSVTDSLPIVSERIAKSTAIPDSEKQRFIDNQPEIQRVATNIIMDNDKNISGTDAIESVADMVFVNPDAIQLHPAEVKPLKDGMVNVKVGGRQFTMRSSDFDSVKALWNAEVEKSIAGIVDSTRTADAKQARQTRVDEAYKALKRSQAIPTPGPIPPPPQAIPPWNVGIQPDPRFMRNP